VALFIGFSLFLCLLIATERYGPVDVVIGHISGSVLDADIICLDSYVSWSSLRTS
jgi:hypothetical protein